MPGQHPAPPARGGPAEALGLGAAAVLLAVAGMFLPVPFLVLVPVPLILLVYRSGYRAASLAGVTALIVGLLERAPGPSSAGAGPLERTHFHLLLVGTALLTVGLVGVTVGGAWREGYSARRTLILGALAFVAPLTVLWAGSLATGRDPGQEARLALEKLAEDVAADLGAREVDAGIRAQVEALFADARVRLELALQLLPGLAATWAFAGTFANMAIARALLRSRGEFPRWFPPFGEWRMPWQFALGFVLGRGLMLAAALLQEARGVLPLGANLTTFFSGAFLVQGLAIVWFYATRWRLAPVLRGSLAMLLVLFLPGLLIWGGVLDTWFNFRRLPVPEEF